MGVGSSKASEISGQSSHNLGTRVRSPKLMQASIIACVRRSSVHFSNLHLFLKNHSANFKQTWQVALLGIRKSNLFKLFQEGGGVHDRKYFSRITSQFPLNLAQTSLGIGG